MRHLAVGQPCPIDRVPAGRRHCSDCPHFVSYRAEGGAGTIGCRQGEDVAAWLRREMGPRAATAGTSRSGAAVLPRPVARSLEGRAHRRPVSASLTRPVGVFLAALGVGLLLSAFDRP